MGRPPKIENVDQQLRGALATLDKSGSAKYYFQIRRRTPPGTMWPFWKHRLPVDDVDDIAATCYNEGGDSHDYKIQIVDENGKIPLGEDGKPIPARTLPALSPPVLTNPATPLTPKDDPDLVERRRKLQRRKEELEIEAEEAEIARRKRRLDAMREGGDDSEDETEEEEAEPQYDPRLDPTHPLFNYAMARHYGFPFGMPEGNGRGKSEQKSDMAILAQAMMQSSQDNSKAMTHLLTALLTQKKDNSDDPFAMMLKFKSAFPSLEPKDIMGMLAPMFGEMHKLQAESSKITMQSMAENQRMMNEKMLEMMAADPNADEGTIERFGKVMGVGGEIVAKVINAIRGGTAKKGDKVDVPNLENKEKKVKADITPDEELPPAEAAKKAVKDRVKLFLLTTEQEMLIGSEPGFVVEKLAEIWLTFPVVLREELLKSEVDKIYDKLRTYEPEIVDRILAAVAEDKAGAHKKWCVEFWDIFKLPDEPDEDDGDDEDDDDGEKPPAVDGGPNGVKKKAATPATGAPTGG